MRRMVDAGAVDLDEAYWIAEPGPQYVRGVMVCSADGAAQVDGKSGGLGGRPDSELFALLRSHAQVIVAGSGTMTAERYGGDQPSGARTAWRRMHGLGPAARMAVVTRSCDIDPAGPLFTDTLVRPLVITCSAAPRSKVRILSEVADIIEAGVDGVDMPAALDQLAALGLVRVSCEGGPNVLAQVAAAGRLDELALTVAPSLLAGEAKRIMTGPALVPAVGLSLAQVLTDDGFLFLRYCRRGAA